MLPRRFCAIPVILVSFFLHYLTCPSTLHNPFPTKLPFSHSSSDVSRVVHCDVCTFLCVSMYFVSSVRYSNLLYFTYSFAMLLCYCFPSPFYPSLPLFSCYLHNFTSTSPPLPSPMHIRPYAHTPAPRIQATTTTTRPSRPLVSPIRRYFPPSL